MADGAVHLGFTYDAVGNRTKVVQNVRVATPVEGSPAVVAGDELRSSMRFFQYDSMNRQTVVDAIDEAGKLGTAGHLLSYDKAGNRISDTFMGKRLKAVIPGVSWTVEDGQTTETYTYDTLNRLTSTTRDTLQVDQYAIPVPASTHTGPSGIWHLERFLDYP